MDGTIWTVDATSGRRGDARRVAPEGTGAMATAVTSDLGRRAVLTLERRIVITDEDTGRVVGAPLQAGSVDLRALTFSPDGSLLAATDDEGALHLWDVTAGRALGPALRTDASAVSPPVFIGDGRTVVTAMDTGLLTWHLEASLWTSAACDLAGRDLTRDEWATYVPGEPYRATCSDG
jgi:WD40 repeat protein